MNKEIETLYEKYCKEIYGESPFTVGGKIRTWIRDLGINEKTTAFRIKTYPLVANINIIGSDLAVHQNQENDIFEDYFVNGNFTAIRFEYVKVKDGIQFIYAEKAVFANFLADYIVFEYYLKNFKFVASDVVHTPLGKNYWKNIIRDALGSKYKVFVIDLNFIEIATITNVDEIDQWYTKPGYSKCMFKISK